ncbi:MAG TPA: hypothetical protein VM901_08405 [Bdellovibrionota bacterium]|nr:hypothetical protein [Bdellovibrionota bacterium]
MKITKFTSTLLVTGASLGGLSAHAVSFEEKSAKTEAAQAENNVKLELYDSFQLDLPGNRQLVVSCGEQKTKYTFNNYEVKVSAQSEMQIKRKAYGETTPEPSQGMC